MPGQVLATGGYQENEKKPEEKPVLPTGTTPPPPPPPVVYVPPTAPVVTPKDQVIPQVVVLDKDKPNDTQLPQDSTDKLKTMLSTALSQNNSEQNNGTRLQRVTSQDEDAQAANTNTVMTMSLTGENENQQVVQTMAALLPRHRGTR